MGKRFILGGNREGWGEESEIWETRKRRRLLEQRMIKRLGFKFRHVIDNGKPRGIIPGSKPLPRDTEIIFISFPLQNYVQNSAITEIVEYLEPYKKAKVIYETGGDRRMWHWHRERSDPFIERCDIILDNQKLSWKSNPHNTVFANQYPRMAKKHIFFPECFAPHRMYTDLPFNEKPIMKCLMSGRPGARYELRNYVIEQLGESEELREYFDIIRHPMYARMNEMDFLGFLKQKYKDVEGYDYKILSNYFKLSFVEEGANEFGNIVGKDYAKCLNRYFCGLGINGGRKTQAAIMKHFEIPAAGSLMLAEPFPDLDRAGFVPGKHYVEIKAEYKGYYETVTDVIERVMEVLQNPDAYQEIRRAGTEFVRKNHSINNRWIQLRKIIKELSA